MRTASAARTPRSASARPSPRTARSSAARPVVLMDCGAYGGEQIFLTTMTAHTLGGNYRLGSVRLVEPRRLHEHRAEPAPSAPATASTTPSRSSGTRTRSATRIGMDRWSSAAATSSATATSARRARSSRATCWARCSSGWRRCARQRPDRADGATAGSTAAPRRSAPGSSSSARPPRPSTSTPTAARRSSPPGVEIGSGSHGAVAAADRRRRLGMRPEDVVVRAADTDAGGFDLGVGGGRTTVSLGAASAAAGDEVRRKLLAAATDMLERRRRTSSSPTGASSIAGAPRRRHHHRRGRRARARSCRDRSPAPGRFTDPGVAAMPGCAAGHFIEAIDLPVFAVHDARSPSTRTRVTSRSSTTASCRTSAGRSTRARSTARSRAGSCRAWATRCTRS